MPVVVVKNVSKIYNKPYNSKGKNSYIPTLGKYGVSYFDKDGNFLSSDGLPVEGGMTGGHIVLYDDKNKDFVFLQGEVDDIIRAFEEYKRIKGVDDLWVIKTDHKAYQYVPEKGKLKGDYNRYLDNLNTSGGNFVYFKIK
jgi:hypothetical protein